jgi:hypothetical protein
LSIKFTAYGKFQITNDKSQIITKCQISITKQFGASNLVVGIYLLFACTQR